MMISCSCCVEDSTASHAPVKDVPQNFTLGQEYRNASLAKHYNIPCKKQMAVHPVHIPR